jgi:hypothetical protein
VVSPLVSALAPPLSRSNGLEHVFLYEKFTIWGVPRPVSHATRTSCMAAAPGLMARMSPFNVSPGLAPATAMGPVAGPSTRGCSSAPQTPIYASHVSTTSSASVHGLLPWRPWSRRVSGLGHLPPHPPHRSGKILARGGNTSPGSHQTHPMQGGPPAASHYRSLFHRLPTRCTSPT